MNIPAELLFDIETLINTAQPQSILLLGDLDPEFLTDYLHQKEILNQSCELTVVPSSEIDSLNKLNRRFDVGIAVDIFEKIDKTTGQQLLAKLRDLLTAQYLIALELNNSNNSAHWALTDLFSFALKKVSSYNTQQQTVSLFKYNIEDYKNTPDWLNADNWANPHLWGKYWW